MADSKELEHIDESSKLKPLDEHAKIKFEQRTNGEGKIEIPESGLSLKCGLTKEELMKYANDPFWIVLRRILLVLFWLLWIAMLVGAIAIIMITPGCAAPKEPQWFESSPMYEIRVDKFSASSNVSKDYLTGIKDKLSYLDAISVSTIILDKLFDAVNMRIIKPSIGSFEDFSALTGNKKVLIKVPVNQVVLDSPAQERDFAVTLNFWLSKGAAGFVFDELELAAKKYDLKKLVGTWNEVISNQSTENFPRAMVLSSYGEPLSEEDFCHNNTLILNYGLTSLKEGFDANDFFYRLNHTIPKNKTCRANLVPSNGDISPLIKRFSPAERDRIIIFTLLADATPFIYFGEEYARDDGDLVETLKRVDRDPEKMNWKRADEYAKKRENNFFNVFLKTSKIRKSEYAIRMGDSHIRILNNSVVAMARIKKRTPCFVVVSNFEKQSTTVNLSELGSFIPEHGEMEIASSGAEVISGKQDLYNLKVGGEETLVLQFVLNE